MKLTIGTEELWLANNNNSSHSVGIVLKTRNNIHNNKGNNSDSNSSNNDACADKSRSRINSVLQELSLNPNITQQIEANAVTNVL